MSYYNNNRYSDYYDDYNEENPIGVLVFLGLLYFSYKYFTDRDTFYQWLIYGILAISLLFLLFVIIKVWKRKKVEKTSIEIKEVNTDIEKMVHDAKKDTQFIQTVKKKNLPTPQAQALHSALIQRGIKCELEKSDGHKHIDIAIPWAKMNIEIDGIQHYIDTKQVKSDIQRNYYSMKKGFKTLRYPNFVIEKYLDKVADSIAKIARDEYYKTR